MFERNRIAETLRSAREERGLSLEQAAQQAGIPLQYLRLLEGEANVRVGVSDELYLIPFFRKYARFVGIDAEELLPEFLGIVQQIPGEGSPPIRLDYRPRWTFLWKPFAVLAAIGLAVFLILRQGHERSAFDDSIASEALPEQAVVTSPAPVRQTAVPDATDAPTAEPAATSPTDAGVAASPSVGVATSTPRSTPAVVTGAHELRITAKEETWLSLALNDLPAKQYMLRPEETRTWHADVFSLTVGNAGGITIAVDGRELPPIGRPGQVVRRLRLPGSEPAAVAPASPSTTAPSPTPSEQQR
jgi:cytoskeletal protein RodZ